MATIDPRVDAYIERAAPFARPVLDKLRKAVHADCPGGAETIKWGMPFFMVEDRILAHMAAFKAHCGFGFWRGRGVVTQSKEDEAMGQFGRIASVADLPGQRELVRLVRLARAASALPAGKKAARRSEAKPAARLPDVLAAALRSHSTARATFEKLPPSHRREYIEWIAEARRDETRARRVAQAIEWLAEGKSRNWKYEAC